MLLASAFGLHGAGFNPIYSALKGGDRGFVKALARDWGPHGINAFGVALAAKTPPLRLDSLHGSPAGHAAMSLITSDLPTYRTREHGGNMPTLSLDHLTIVGATPDEMVSIAAELGYEAVGPLQFATPPEYGLFVSPLERSAPHTRDMIARMRDTGVFVNNMDGYPLLPDTDIDALREPLAFAAELGARRVVTLNFDPDSGRAFDRFCRLSEEARSVGLGVVLEFMPLSQIPSLNDAVSWIRRAQQPNAQILIDVLHLMKSGGSPADIASVDPALIAAAQLCDGPSSPTDEQYAYAAIHERQVPGEGELPLVAFLAALPEHATIGLEVPSKSLRDQGVPPKERARRCIAATRQLLEKAKGGSTG